jgi:pyruvate/2-oxoglutarate dehydrogenase complex dihydrolipoamide acyltransferase (E2) component
VELSVWFAKVGEHVFEGERLVEVLLNGATFDVASPATGRLVSRAVAIRDSVAVGQRLGEIETDPEGDDY